MRAGLLQMRAAAGDKAANLARISAAASDASRAGCDILIAPELALTGYGVDGDFAALATPAGGGDVAALSGIAAGNGIAIVAGFAELDGGVIYNSAVLATADGGRSVYRKSHLYGDYERARFTAAAPKTVSAVVAGISVGILICYDVEFPENVRRLALGGVGFVAVPTALPSGAYSRFIARQLVPVRAFENQVFIGYANHCGTDGLFDYAGLSIVAAPDGTTIGDAGDINEGLVVAEIDPSAYKASAAQNSYLADLSMGDRR